MISPCKDCDVSEPPTCRKFCAVLKAFQKTLGASMGGDGDPVRHRHTGPRRGAP